MRIYLTALFLVALSTTCAFAADAEKKCEMGLIDTLPVSLTGIHLVPTIAGSINGKPTTVGIDVSAFGTHVAKSVLDEMGITSWNTRGKVDGTGGNFRVMDVRLRELKAGPARGSGVFEVLDVDTEVGFNMGADMLLRGDLEISLKEKVLKFFRTRHCEKSHLAYWDPNAVIVPFTVRADDDLRPIFKVRVNGQEMTAILSTMSSHTMINMRAAKRIGLTLDSPQVSAGGKAKGLTRQLLSQWEAKIDTLEVGEERISNIKIGMIMSDVDVDVADMYLGMDFVRAHRIYISMDQRLIYFSYIGGEIFAKQFSRTPAWIQAELDSGNPDAFYSRAAMSENAGDTESAIAWFEKAAAKGKDAARVDLATLAYAAGDFARSAGLFKAQQRKARTPVLSAWIYLATARAGQGAQALAELKADQASSPASGWYANVINYLLSGIDAPALNAMVVKKGATAQTPACVAGFFVAQNLILQDNHAAAKPLLESVVRDCSPNAGPYRAAQADLARMKL